MPWCPLLQAGLEGLPETAGTQRLLVAWERKLLRRTRLPAGKAVGEEPQCGPAVSVWKRGGQRGARCSVSKVLSRLAPNTAPALPLGPASTFPFLPADRTKQELVRFKVRFLPEYFVGSLRTPAKEGLLQVPRRELKW